jgi:predicted RNase H-like HicB family nuclease
VQPTAYSLCCAALRFSFRQRLTPSAFARQDERQGRIKENDVRTYTAVVEKRSHTGWYVGYVSGFPGAHSQGETMDELAANLKEVIEMLLEEGEPKLEVEFVST